MWRRYILKFLCYSQLFIPGSLNKPRLTLPLLNIWAFLSLIALGNVIHHAYDELSHAILYSPPQQLKNGQINSNISSESSESLVKFSHIFPHTVSSIINICFRIVSFFLYPALVKVCTSLANLKIKSTTLSFTCNEVCFLILSVFSTMLRQLENWHRTPPSMPYIERIYGHLVCLIGEAFTVNLAGVTLVCFVTLISSYLKGVADSLEIVRYPIAWTVEGNSFQ